MGCQIKVSRDGALNECRDDIEVLRSSSGQRWMEVGLGGREEGAGTMWYGDKRTGRLLVGAGLEEGKGKAGLSQ